MFLLPGPAGSVGEHLLCTIVCSEDRSLIPAETKNFLRKMKQICIISNFDSSKNVNRTDTPSTGNKP